MNKYELRKIYLEKRSSLAVGQVAEMSGRIARRFFENVDLSGVKTIHTFIPIRKFNEVDTSMIYYRIWRDMPEVMTVAPRTSILDGRIESVRFDAATEWAENSWGIREPLGSEFIETKSIDLVMVPLLAFDSRGHRVGYGKGIYDRFLVECRPDCLKVGLSYLPPVEAIDDTEETDIRLDMCVTPAASYLTK